MPDAHRLGAEKLEREACITVVVRPGERHNSDARTLLSHVSSIDDLEALDERVRKELGAHALDLAARGLRVVGVHLEVDEAADASPGDREPEGLERSLNRLTLWIEDSGLRSDQDRQSHSTDSGSSKYRSSEMSVSRSKASA